MAAAGGTSPASCRAAPQLHHGGPLSLCLGSARTACTLRSAAWARPARRRRVRGALHRLRVHVPGLRALLHGHAPLRACDARGESPFTSVVQVLSAALKKRSLKQPKDPKQDLFDTLVVAASRSPPCPSPSSPCLRRHCGSHSTTACRCPGGGCMVRRTTESEGETEQEPRMRISSEGLYDRWGQSPAWSSAPPWVST